MTIAILTLFEKMFSGIFSESIIKRAQNKKLLKINFVNVRDFAKDKRRTVDDKPYGGGTGMVMRADVVIDALESIKPKPYTILLSPSGQKYTQTDAQVLSGKKALALICGHYEGIDTRVEKFVDKVYSVGDFILTGGEIAAMAIIDSVARLIPGVINVKSLSSESFSPTIQPSNHPTNLLEYPQYTRPENFRGHLVPKVLLSGNHRKIEEWRKKQSLKRTKKLRGDLLS